MARIFGGPGVYPSNAAIPGYGDEMLFQAGQTWTLPAGTFLVTSTTGLTMLQSFDPITGTWRPRGACGPAPRMIQSEGNNYRLSNGSGCAVGAFVTAKGSDYTSAPSVLPSAGNSKWMAIIGQNVTSVSVTNGGASYVYPPLVVFDAPPGFPSGMPGFIATGYATLTSGAVSSITVTDQGAGYSAIPNVYLINDPRDTTGYGATATAVMGGTGMLNGIVCTDHGTPVASLPTLTISGGGGASGAATVIADFAVTGLTVSGGGTGFPASSAAIVEPIAVPLTGAAWTNPTMETSILLQRNAKLVVPTTSGNALTATGAAGFGGSYPAAPTAYGVQTSTLITGSPTITFAVGGQPDTILIAQI